MSVETALKEETLNRRQAYKNQKLQEANEIYYCECGKNYLTFSALYLHARNKHEVKLTTKRSLLNCKVQQREDKSIVTYFINTPQIEQSVNQPLPLVQNNSQPQQDHSHIPEVLNLYLSEENSQFATTRICKKMIVQQLINYFQQIQQLKTQYYPLQTEDMTLYFNDFIVAYFPLAHQQGLISLNALAQAQNELIQLWRWLREHKYTQTQLLHRTYPPYFNS